jgi:hypothetical protein
MNYLYSYDDLLAHMKNIRAYMSWTCDQSEEEIGMTNAIVYKLMELAGQLKDYSEISIKDGTVNEDELEKMSEEITDGTNNNRWNKLYTC